MEETLTSKKRLLPHFPAIYWLAVVFEFFERGAYYGMLSILAVYLTDKLHFSVMEAGSVLGIIQPIVYFLPILAGAIADKVGYRRMLTIAFSLLGVGYFFVSQSTEYLTVFASLAIMAVGAGTFKPIISGTIARVTDKSNSFVGFGIYYWSINFGAFLFPLFIVPFLKSIAWNYVFLASALFTGLMLIPTIFLYKEPTKTEPESAKENVWKLILDILKKIGTVLIDWRFILFICLYSLFWVLYFQMYGTVLWYVQIFVDATPLNRLISGVFGIVWNFDVEYVTVINAGTIIILQLIVAKLVERTKPINTIIAGFSIATLGMFILAFSLGIWVLIVGLMTFSLGEMIAHPKYISYLGLIAPADKKATYLGFGFLYGVFGSFVGSIVGSRLYDSMISSPMLSYIRIELAKAGEVIADSTSLAEAVKIAESIGISKDAILMQGNPSGLWLIFCSIGLVGIAGMVLYSKIVRREKTDDANVI